jgi:sulfate transport system permease protein
MRLFPRRTILPGFGLSLGYTLAVLSVFLFLPVAVLIARAASLGPEKFLAAVWTERARAAYALTFGASFAAGVIDTILGLLVAWVFVRYDFPFKRFFDALIDLPFALPTAVAGLVYAVLYVPDGWLGRFLVPIGIEGANSRFSIVLVLTFIGLPFVVRAVQPVLESLDQDVEEAAASLGATRLQVFTKVLFPALQPALMTGFALTFARSIGEYGSVVFVSGNLLYKTEIAPVLIVSHLDAHAYPEATAVACVLLASSFAMLAIINTLERWSRRYEA